MVIMSRFPEVIFGRRFKPLSLGVAIAMLAVGLGPFYDGPGQTFEFNSAPGVIQATAAGVGFIFFVIGWIARSEQAVKAGLLLAVGVFMARAVVTALTVGVVHPAFGISLSWVVAAGGAYLLEREDGVDYE